jgi:hypothetical protein
VIFYWLIFTGVTLYQPKTVRCDISIGINAVCDIFQAQYPCVIFKCHEEELWQFLVKTRNLGYIDMCDVTPVDIYGCDTLPAINRQV